MREVSLLDLSPVGLNELDLEDALKYPERARMISIDEPTKKVLKLKRVYKIDLGIVAPPSWIGELKHLRSIKCMANMKKLPAALATLPRLKYLFLDDSKLESLDGIEKLPAIDTITLGRTPAQALLPAMKIRDARATSWSIEFDRKTEKPPRDKKKLLKLLADDAIDDGADLKGVDLSGATFEDLYVTYDFSKAKLAGTTWRRCDFENAKLTGADLTGATFEDCYFSSFDDSFAKVKASGATFQGCGGTLELAGADLRGAKFVDMDSDVHYELDGAKCSGMELHATFCSEREHAVSAKGADLKGAKIYFDVTPDRRATITSKKTSKFAWKMDHLKGAKTDKTTQIEYADLGGKPSKKSNGLDEAGPCATTLGTIYAPNAGLWLLAIDAADAAAWRGSVDENDKTDDFQRALRKDGPIKVGKATGMIVAINHTNGWSHVWNVDGGIALLDWSVPNDDKKAVERALGLRLAQWKPYQKPTKLGSIRVHSGVLALQLPYCDGTWSARELAKAKKSFVQRVREYDRALVPLPNGTYHILQQPFAPSKGYEDELGEYYTVTRIVQSTTSK